jgi:leucyl aminopeptidase (aminopeptidase T)
MIGSQEMVVSGVDSAGSRSEVLREGRWSR